MIWKHNKWESFLFFLNVGIRVSRRQQNQEMTGHYSAQVCGLGAELPRCMGASAHTRGGEKEASAH